MKKLITGILALFLLMASTPAIISIPKAASSLSAAAEEGEGIDKTSPKNGGSENEKSKNGGNADGFLLAEENGKVDDITALDALTGALSSVMPQDCIKEAGYALSSAIYSRMLYLKNERNGARSAESAELSKGTDGKIVYLSKNEIIKRFGDDFYALCKKYAQYGIKHAVKYKGKPFDARIFNSCGGSTESSEDILETALPCHVSVPSPWDLTGDITSETSYSFAEAKKIAKKSFNAENIPSSAEKLIKIKNTSQSGTVLKAEICGTEVSGTDIMKAFYLCSPNFKIKGDKNKLTFIVTGNGIPVGMSISGAEGMARQGARAEEILSHYYPGCTPSGSD